MTNDRYATALDAVRLWVHEADRVFSDRLVNDTDHARYSALRIGTCRKHFDDLSMVNLLLNKPAVVALTCAVLSVNITALCNWLQDEVDAKPLLMATFLEASTEDVPLYTPVSSYEELKAVLEAKLSEHNESNPVMDLVLFQQVIQLCLI